MIESASLGSNHFGAVDPKSKKEVGVVVGARKPFVSSTYSVKKFPLDKERIIHARFKLSVLFTNRLIEKVQWLRIEVERINAHVERVKIRRRFMPSYVRLYA